MPVPCKVCSSPHREEYEDMRLNKKMTLLEISQYARLKYNEDISTASLSRHFTRHVEAYYKKAFSSDSLRMRYMKEQMNAIMRAAKSIRKQLEVLEKQLEKVIENLDDPDSRREAREIMHSTKELVELMFRFEDKFKAESRSETELYDKIMEIIKDFPPELVNLFIERWNKLQ